jgi:hypothetical protein
MKPELFLMFLLALLAAALSLVLVFLFMRNRRHQLLHIERMAALEKGVSLPAIQPERPWSPRVYLLRGLVWSFCGAALLICLLGLAAGSRRPESASGMAFEARRLSDEAGISREEAKQIVEKDAASHTIGLPPSVALLGLMPLAVGLAYLIFYYTGESPKRASGEAGVETDRV